MTWRVSVALVLSLGPACSPNIVVGTRERDAAIVDAVDAAAPQVQLDAGPVVMAGSDAGAALDASQTLAPREDASQAMPMAASDAAIVCVSSDQCSDPEEPLCDLAAGSCVECLSDADCAANELCESDRECGARPVPCTSALQCLGRDEAVCHPSERVCVECVSDSDCTGAERCQPDYECD